MLSTHCSCICVFEKGQMRIKSDEGQRIVDVKAAIDALSALAASQIPKRRKAASKSTIVSFHEL